MKTFKEIVAYTSVQEDFFLSAREEFFIDAAEDDLETLEFIVWSAFTNILEFSLGTKNCRIIEDIHGGMDGIMEALMRVGKFDLRTSDFGPIIQMVMIFQQMVKDYKKGPKFYAELGWHKNGRKKKYTF